jgi:hypothetical protein
MCRTSHQNFEPSPCFICWLTINISHKAVGMFIVFVRTKLNMPTSSRSLVIDIKAEAKYGFHKVLILLFTFHKSLTRLDHNPFDILWISVWSVPWWIRHLKRSALFPLFRALRIEFTPCLRLALIPFRWQCTGPPGFGVLLFAGPCESIYWELCTVSRYSWNNVPHVIQSSHFVLSPWIFFLQVFLFKTIFHLIFPQNILVLSMPPSPISSMAAMVNIFLFPHASLCARFPVRLSLVPWRWWKLLLMENLYPSSKLHGARSQKTVIYFLL